MKKSIALVYALSACGSKPVTDVVTLDAGAAVDALATVPFTCPLELTGITPVQPGDPLPAPGPGSRLRWLAHVEGGLNWECVVGLNGKPTWNVENKLVWTMNFGSGWAIEADGTRTPIRVESIALTELGHSPLMAISDGRSGTTAYFSSAVTFSGSTPSVGTKNLGPFGHLPPDPGIGASVYMQMYNRRDAQPPDERICDDDAFVRLGGVLATFVSADLALYEVTPPGGQDLICK